MFWDLGSQVTLVTTHYAREQRLRELGCSSPSLSGLRGGPALRATVKYKVVLVNTGGNQLEVIDHCLEQIASNMDAVDPRILRKAFPEVPGEHIEGASGRVGLLIRQNNFRLFSIKEKRAGGLALFRSRFLSAEALGIDLPRRCAIL
jgi:hypothetical protein